MQTKINVETLHSLICEQGLLKAIHQTFGSSVKIRIFIPDNVCKLSINELDLSVRGNNCLKLVSMLPQQMRHTNILVQTLF